jgi:hypothetical protein
MKRIYLAVAAAIAIWAAPANATPLAPGGSTNVVPTITESGTIIGTVSTQFSYGTGLTAVAGILREVVVQQTGSSKLDFLFQVALKPSGVPGGSGKDAVLNMFTVTGFGLPLSTDVFQTTDASGLNDQGFFTNPLKTGTQAIMAASRSPGTGDGVTFFAPTGAGQNSNIGIIQTNSSALGFATGTATLDGHTLVFNTLTPLPTSVPEPITLALWGGSFVGLAGVGLLRRRKAVAA